MNPRGWRIKFTQNSSMGTCFGDVIKMAAHDEFTDSMSHSWNGLSSLIKHDRIFILGLNEKLLNSLINNINIGIL